MVHRYLLLTAMTGMALSPLQAYSVQDNALFHIDQAQLDAKNISTSVNDESSKTRTWNIEFDLTQVNANSNGFSLSLPGVNDGDAFWVSRSFHKRVESGNTQWGGEIVIDSQPVGDVVVNVVNGMPFAIINVNEATFEIQTDHLLGTRLVEVTTTQNREDAVIKEIDVLAKKLNGNLDAVKNSRISTISNVDVLIVVDEDLNYSGSPIFETITKEFTNANEILSTTKIDATQAMGIPLRINHMGTQFIDIPDEFENIKDEVNIAGLTFPAYNHLTNDVSALSVELKTRLRDSGADYLALYIPYDPNDSASEFCGKATLPTDSTDLSLPVSIVLLADACNENQFVLLHELVHNFGARHDSGEDIGYEAIASGFNVTNSTVGNFSTLMGCTTSGAYDPSSTDCGRIKQLSSPRVTIGGKKVGDESTADNVTYLSLCEKGGTCRREELATRNSRLPNGNFAPGITVTSHENSETFQVTRAFNLTADVFDDNGIASVKWEVIRPLFPHGEEVLDVGFGASPDYNYVTDVLDTSGVYRIRLTVTDNENLQSSTDDVIFTEGTLPDEPQIDTGNAVCGHRYCIRLEGENFGANASVEVREDFDDSPVLETYAGNLIHGRGISNTTGKDFLRFPIVSVDQQTKFRNNGLCFIVKNGSLSSNELCLTRPNTAPQGQFMGEDVVSYTAGQDPEFDAYIVKNAGTVLKIWGNSWKKIDQNYTITPSTVLEFDFKSTHQEGEITGIGFQMNGSGVNFSQRFWQVHGTQSWGIQDYNNYSGNGTVTYRIPVGQYVTGDVTAMVFASDDDAIPRAGQANLFISPVLFEEEIDAYDDVPFQRAYSDDAPGDAVPIFAGAAAQMHNFHDQGDGDWTIFAMQDGGRVDIRTTQLGSASAQMIAYRVDGAYSETSPGRWDITQSDLTHIADDFSTNNNYINIENTTGSTQVYVIRTFSSGPYGNNTNYSIRMTANPIPVDQYDNVPSQRAYNDDLEGQAVHWLGGDTGHFHNFHDSGDVDWTIVYGGGSIRFKTQLLGADADTKMTVYKWISADPHPSNDGRFINISHAFVGQDHGAGASQVVVNSTQPETYAIKIESRNNVYGSNTDYKLVLESP